MPYAIAAAPKKDARQPAAPNRQLAAAKPLAAIGNRQSTIDNFSHLITPNHT
jgi:hypothetical protein